MKEITKAVIPAAGFGTRLLPVTKAQPKELLPVVDKPAIQYIVEEAVASGIRTIIIVTTSDKSAIEDHFDTSSHLEEYLERTGKIELLEMIRKISQMANFIFIRQKGFYGNGTPVLNARAVIGNEPFAVIWGDDIVESEKPRLKQLMEVYYRYESPVLTAYPVDDEGTKKYGIIEGEEIEPRVFRVRNIIEKPGPENTSSRIASIGGYILTPDIFQALEKTSPGKDNELWLVDAIFNLAKKRPIYACMIEGVHYDIGSRMGWLKTNIELGLKNREIAVDLRKYLREIVDKIG